MFSRLSLLVAIGGAVGPVAAEPSLAPKVLIVTMFGQALA
jgi:hypothetical protein